MSFSSLTSALGSSSVQLGFHSNFLTEALHPSSKRKKLAFRKFTVSCSSSSSSDTPFAPSFITSFLSVKITESMQSLFLLAFTKHTWHHSPFRLRQNNHLAKPHIAMDTDCQKIKKEDQDKAFLFLELFLFIDNIGSVRPHLEIHVSCSYFLFVFYVDPLLVKAAKGHPVSRPPAWMMRQAGRYMAVYRKLAEKHPSFRERSETTDLIVQISLQPWEAFHPDGVIIFSDILTPLPAFGVPFDIEEVRGPVIQSPIRSEEGLKALHHIDLEKLQFVGDSLKILRKEVGEHAAVLGFVGAPWTIATYIVEGGTTRTYTTIKSMCHTAPHVLRTLLSHLTQAIADYIIYQVESGAHCIQIFDSWGGQLPPHMWEQWSEPYIREIVSLVRTKCPETPIVLYINGNGGFLERMKGTGVDVIGLDWTVDMADGRKRLGNDISVQGNVDPACLFSPLPALTDEIQRVVKCAGSRGHILNLGHGVLVGTPEEAVAHFFEVAKSMKYDNSSQNHAFEESKLVV